MHGRANEGRISAVDAPLDRAQRAKCRNVHGPVGPGGRRNRGAWMFMSDKLMEMLPDKVVHNVGRDEIHQPRHGLVQAAPDRRAGDGHAGLGTLPRRR